MTQMVEGDQGVGLASSVGQLQLPDRLVVLALQAAEDIRNHLAQVESGIG